MPGAIELSTIPSPAALGNLPSISPQISPPGLVASSENVVANGSLLRIPEPQAQHVRVLSPHEIDVLIDDYINLYGLDETFIPDTMINYLIAKHYESRRQYYPWPWSRGKLVSQLQYRMKTAHLVRGYSNMLGLASHEECFVLFGYTTWRMRATISERWLAEATIAYLKKLAIVPKPRREEGNLFERPVQWLAVGFVNKMKALDINPDCTLWSVSNLCDVLMEIASSLDRRNDNLMAFKNIIFRENIDDAGPAKGIN